MRSAVARRRRRSDGGFRHGCGCGRLESDGFGGDDLRSKRRSRSRGVHRPVTSDRNGHLTLRLNEFQRRFRLGLSQLGNDRFWRKGRGRFRDEFWNGLTLTDRFPNGFRAWRADRLGQFRNSPFPRRQVPRTRDSGGVSPPSNAGVAASGCSTAGFSSAAFPSATVSAAAESNPSSLSRAGSPSDPAGLLSFATGAGIGCGVFIPLGETANGSATPWVAPRSEPTAARHNPCHPGRFARFQITRELWRSSSDQLGRSFAFVPGRCVLVE